MGGANSEVSDSTQDVFLESAYFALEAIAGAPAGWVSPPTPVPLRARRGLHPASRSHGERATALILDICGGQAGPVTEAVATAGARRRSRCAWRGQPGAGFAAER